MAQLKPSPTSAIFNVLDEHKNKRGSYSRSWAFAKLISLGPSLDL